MIFPAAIVAAMAFWAPLNNGAPVCGGTLDGAYVHVVSRQEASAAVANVIGDGLAVLGYTTAPGSGCEIWLTDDITDPAIECEVAAHELGHAVFDFGHSDDPTNVMAPAVTEQNMPAACAALRPKPAVHLGTALRVERRRECKGHAQRRRCYFRTIFYGASS